MNDVPLEHLSLRDGALSLAAGAHPPLPYLETGAVRIVGKNNMVALDAGLVSFMFALSEVPDETWVDAFAAARAGLRAEIQGAQVDLHCQPGDLDADVAKLKMLIAHVNDQYLHARTKLVEQVAALDRSRRDTATAAAAHMRSAADRFDRLDI